MSKQKKFPSVATLVSASKWQSFFLKISIAIIARKCEGVTNKPRPLSRVRSLRGDDNPQSLHGFNVLVRPSAKSSVGTQSSPKVATPTNKVTSPRTLG